MTDMFTLNPKMYARDACASTQQTISVRCVCSITTSAKSFIVKASALQQRMLANLKMPPLHDVLLESLRCEIERLEGRQNREGNFAKATKLRPKSNDTRDNSKDIRNNCYHEDHGQRWDRFSNQQKRNTVLPTRSGIVKGLYDSIPEQKQIRRHGQGNVEIGPISHRMGVFVA